MVGDGNKVASVIMFTFTKMPGPYVHTAWDAQPLCSHSLWDALLSESGYCTTPVFTGSDSLHCQLFLYLKLIIFI